MGGIHAMTVAVLVIKSFLYFRKCPTPKLKKFGGKATEFSPRARIRGWMGFVIN
jgi:hypothetical protein